MCSWCRLRGVGMRAVCVRGVYVEQWVWGTGRAAAVCAVVQGAGSAELGGVMVVHGFME